MVDCGVEEASLLAEAGWRQREQWLREAQVEMAGCGVEEKALGAWAVMANRLETATTWRKPLR